MGSYKRWWMSVCLVAAVGRQARCARYERQRFGARLDGGYGCEPLADARGKPRMTCMGPGIDACMESFARDVPSTSVQNRRSLDLSLELFGIGQEGSVSVSWGGKTGFASACRTAGEQAALTCLSELGTCAERAGGCER